MIDIQHKQAHSILSKANGFIKSFDFTLNPYSGCAFGCSYCYAAFFAPTQDLQNQWGQWVAVKENALALLHKKRKRPLIDKSIYISSVTDPYQPLERDLQLTRAILQELLAFHRVQVVIQTRSPLVTRDIDLLSQFEKVRVHMTVTTDDDAIRKVFEPFCASNAQRLNAIAHIAQANIPTSITMTPLLPVTNAQAFAHSLLATGVTRFVIQDFHETTRRFVAGTGERARQLLAERHWDKHAYAHVKAILEATLPNCVEGQAGFAP